MRESGFFYLFQHFKKFYLPHIFPLWDPVDRLFIKSDGMLQNFHLCWIVHLNFYICGCVINIKFKVVKVVSLNSFYSIHYLLIRRMLLTLSLYMYIQYACIRIHALFVFGYF